VCLAATTQVLRSAGIVYETAHICTSSIDSARNILATLFVRGSCSHMLFIDDDVVWAADLPLRMLNENVDIVGVPYRKKIKRPEYTIKHPRNVGSLGGRHWMILAEGLGMGMTLIRRNVFEGLIPKVPLYHCFGGEEDKPQHLFFRHELVTDTDGKLKYESEDFHFCRLARENGFELFAYIDENLPHVGRCIFDGPYNMQINGGIPHGFTGERERLPVIVTGVEG
jgi:hypothetical protein